MPAAEHMREYNRRPEVQERSRAYARRSDVKARRRLAQSTPAARAKARVRRAAHPEWDFAQRYGMMVEQARATLAAKPSTCEICTSEAVLRYDHCHQTGLHRGWLCHSCNTALGLFADSPERLAAAIRYLHGERL